MTKAKSIQPSFPNKRDSQKPNSPGGTKITDRPSSASAGQRFIGKSQNLKELFEKNWQNVNFTQKIDPASGA